ncbi:hypothetical protein H5410_062064 [Solanum commersonii]|uniref:Uncharacterized protein n=1 Tax=Solanum commersonii TaxID=4109 RepID=A0A9J5W9Q3_SOLCO|nr:hypothetical protein H5410_062064 [Solanum commersonii]
METNKKREWLDNIRTLVYAILICVHNSLIEANVSNEIPQTAKENTEGGRVKLINSVLDALLSYMMSLFPIPISVTKILDNIRRYFLWQGNKEKKGFYLVK